VVNPRYAAGLAAEGAVARWLSAAGWAVLERRWRVPEGELDLVCLDTVGCLVAVEVRMRTSDRTGSAVGSVDARRIGRLQRALVRYARGTELFGSAMRVDLVTVTPDGNGDWRLSRHPDLGAEVAISGRASPRGRRPR
jgi:putative endonuclease